MSAELVAATASPPKAEGALHLWGELLRLVAKGAPRRTTGGGTTSGRVGWCASGERTDRDRQWDPPLAWNVDMVPHQIKPERNQVQEVTCPVSGVEGVILYGFQLKEET